MAPVSALCHALLRALRGEASSTRAPGSSRGRADRPGLAPRALASVQVLMLAGLLPCTQGWAQTTPRVAANALPTGNSQKSGTPVVYGPASVNPTTGRLTAILKQSDATNIVDWRTFDIGSAAQLNIVQPSATAVLLNKVAGGEFQNKTVIDGVMNANGRVYLYNPNGIVFGRTAVVNTGSLIASTLKFDESRVIGGLLRQSRDPQLAADAALGRVPGAVVVEGDAGQHARLSTEAGGLLLLAAPQVTNGGVLSAPDGQVMLAAGSKVYLAAPDTTQTGTSLRGLLVEVSNDALPVVQGGTGTAENTASGRIDVGRGNATLIGYAVNQKGMVSASTSVSLNGSVYLLARDQAGYQDGRLVANRAGPVVLGPDSQVEIRPTLEDKATITASTRFNPSEVQVSGQDIRLQEGARIVAQGGKVGLSAARLGTDPDALPPDARTSPVRVDLAPGSLIDVSGSRGTTLPMESNVVTVDLRGTELADNVVLRDSALYGAQVRIDARKGTQIADVSGWLALRQFGLGEINTTGGSVKVSAEGAIIQRPGSRIDVDGGYVDYLSGHVNTTQLALGTSVVDIGSAKSGVAYTAALDLPDSPANFESGYRQGASAGTASFTAPILVLQGGLSGQASRGPYQRDPSAAGYPQGGQLLIGDVNERTFGSSGRSNPANAGPGGYEGLLRFGTDLTRKAAAPGVGEAFDLSNPDQGLLASRLDIDLGQLSLAGFSRLSALTAGNIEVVQPVQMAPGGRLWLGAGQRAFLREGESEAPDGGRVALKAPVTIPGGSLALTGTSVDVADGVALDLAGRWVNDRGLTSPPLDGAGRPVETVVTRGGAVNLAGTSVHVGDGVSMDVSAGAWLDSKGRTAQGSAGQITLEARADGSALSVQGASLGLGAGLSLAGYGFGSGGGLKLTGRNVTLGATGPAASAVDLRLSADFFQQGGFTAYDIGANLNLTVAQGAQIEPRAARWALSPDAATTPSGRLGAVASTVVPALSGPSLTRATTSLTLRATSNLPGLAGLLRVEEGASVDLDPSATLRLVAGRQLSVLGSLDAPAGRIQLIQNGQDSPMWFGPAASVRAEGSTDRLYTAGDGVSSGEVLAGGSILVGGGTDTRADGTVYVKEAQGAIVMNPGAVFSVAGAGAGTRVFRSGSGLSPAQPVSSGGGRIEIRSAGSLTLLGQFRGGPGGPDSAGGSLFVGLEATDAALNVLGGANARSEAQALLKSTEKNFTPTPGVGVLDARGLEEARFSDLTLRSSDAVAFGLGAGDLTLKASRSIVVDARTLRSDDAALSKARQALVKVATKEIQARDAADDSYQLSADEVAAAAEAQAAAALAASGFQLDRPATVRLLAPYVRVGDGSSNQTVYPAQGDTADTAVRSAMSGNATLAVQAANIDLKGHSALQGFGKATFAAEQDIRLDGVAYSDPAGRFDGTQRGSFWMKGQLDLVSSQLYPTTLSDFTLAVDTADGSDGAGRLSFLSNGKPTGPVWSAGASLRALAPHIVQAGRVLAPFGRIEMGSTDAAADGIVTSDLSYGAGSLTSVAGSGQVPLGIVSNGSVPTASRWSVLLGDGTEVVIRQNPDPSAVIPERALPAKAILSRAGSISTDPTSVIDLSGGGSLFAYGFTPGRGGSQDVLANNTLGTRAAAPTATFAIVPGFSGKVAPVDGTYGADGGLAPGDAVWLSGVPGLAAGVYTLLPAHYALLPGAFSITAQAGTRDMAASANTTLGDGSLLVSGRLAQAGSGAVASRTQGFVLSAGPVVRRRSEFALYDAGAYFQAKASAGGLPRPELPRDGGHVVFDATAAGSGALSLPGGVRLTAAAGGQAGRADFAAPALEVSSSGGRGAGGAAQLPVAWLDALGASSLSLGAVREEGGGAATVSVKSRTLSLSNDEAHPLVAPEITLAATDQLKLAPGAAVRSEGAPVAKGADLTVEGGGALLRLSTGGAVALHRTGAAASGGALEIGAGATVKAAGSVQIDAGGRAVNAGFLEVAPGGEFTAAVPGISLGASIPGDVAARTLAFSGESLAALGRLSFLSLDSLQAPIGLYGALQLGTASMKQLTLAGAGLASGAAADGSGTDASIVAQHVQIEGRRGAGTPPTGSGGSGQVTVRADTIGVGSGSFLLDGFPGAQLSAAGELRATGRDGVLATDGSLLLDAGRIVTAPGADATFRAARDLTLASTAAAPTADANGFGGQLVFEGDNLRSTARIELPSGQVVLRADRSLDLSAGSVSVAGASAQFAQTVAHGPGGTIELSGGRVALGAEAVLDVSAVGAEAGTLKITAVRPDGRGALDLQGRLRGSAASLADQPVPAQGRVFMDVDTAGTAADFGALNATLNEAGFTQARDFRVRRGDVELGVSGQITAHEVVIAADAGSIRLAPGSRIDASGASGGSIELAARQAAAGQPDGPGGRVTVSQGAELIASAQAASGTGSSGHGGRVFISTATSDGSAPATVDGAAAIRLEGGLIDVSGAGQGSNGSVTLRAPRTGTGAGDDVAVAALASNIRGSASTVIEAYKVYAASRVTERPDGSGAQGTNLDAGANGALFREAGGFVEGRGAAVLERLGDASGAPRLRAGIEIRDEGAGLTVSVNEFAARAADRGWDLQAWRFGGEPIGLTLRSAGDLKVIGSIGDGFIKPAEAGRSMPAWRLASGDSADLRLVAGADAAAAHPLAVVRGTGDFSVDFAQRTPDTAAPVTSTDAPVAMVRTGTGRIDIAAGRDVTLGMAPFFRSRVADETIDNPLIFDALKRDGTYDVTLYGATVYTAGKADAGTAPAFGAPVNALNTHYGAGPDDMTPATFARAGGAVTVSAGRDVIGPRNLGAGWFYRNNDGVPAYEGDPTASPPDPALPAQPGSIVALPRVVPQMVNNWLFRQGRSYVDENGQTRFETLADGKTTLNTAWWIRTDFFDQGIAALAGGDVRISAGRNVSDLSLSATGSAFVPQAGAAPVEHAGGDLSVRAGGDIEGGQFYVQKGVLSARAQGSVVAGHLEALDARGTGQGLNPVIALGDAQASVVAARSLALETVYNPTMTEQSLNNQDTLPRDFLPVYKPNDRWDLANAAGADYRTRYAQFSNFLSYSPDSAVRLTALGGDLLLSADAQGLSSAAGWQIPNRLRVAAPLSSFPETYGLMPPNLLAVSMAGNLETARGFSLSPSPGGQLELLAAGSVRLNSGDARGLRMMDNSPAGMSTALAPRVLSQADTDIIAGSSIALESHDAQGLHANDARAALVVAATGDVRGDPAAVSSLTLPKRAEIVAGRDIVDLGLRIQHLADDDVSLLQAGRDLIDSTQAVGLARSPSAVAHVVTGPGRLDVVAGRDVDLGNGSGFVTRGNLDNPYLPEGGVALRVVAGTGAPNYGGFVEQAARYGSVYDLSVTSLLPGLQAETLSADGLGDLARVLKAAGREVPTTLADARALLRTERSELLALDAFVRGIEPGLPEALGAESLWALFRGLAPSAQARFLGEHPAATRRLVARADRLRQTLAAGDTLSLDAAFFRGLVETGRAKELAPFDTLIASMFPDAAKSAGGDISNFGSQFKTEQGGSIALYAPSGSVYAGLTLGTSGKVPSVEGIFTVRGGAVGGLVKNDFLVNKGRVFTLGGGDITLVSQQANIDAGRGAKTASSAPPPLLTVDPNGNIKVDISSSIAGSGIATLKTREDLPAGDVFAIAPRGVFDAGDAGVRSSGSVLVVAPVVLNAANITASGSVSGAAPAVAAPSLGSVAAPASSTARTDDVAKAAGGPTANAANYALSVDVVGMGDAAGDGETEDERKKKRSTNTSKEKGSTQ